MFQTIEADREAEGEASEADVTLYKADIEPEGQCTGHRRQRSCRITGVKNGNTKSTPEVLKLRHMASQSRLQGWFWWTAEAL